jgi:geranylgeranyl diphosphate synthase type I
MSLGEALAQYTADVDLALVRVFEDMASAAARMHTSALEMAEVVRDFTCGPGKRLRPVLMRVAYEGLGGTETEAIVRASCATELMQSFLLIHDDIMDRSDLRRGQPTLHRLYRNHYASHVADPEHFGSAMAMLAGDLANQVAMLLLTEAAFPPDRVARALACYNRIAVDVCYGQGLDMLLPQRPVGDIRKEDVWKVMEYKTARYTIEGPLHLGAVLAPPRDGILEQLSAYGVPLGVAFQLQDDILGLFGRGALTGKSTVSDLTDGKRTLLLVEAWKRADERQRQVLSLVLGNPSADADDVEAARRVLEDTGARARTSQLAQDLAMQARSALTGIPLAARERRFLAALADYIVGRQR